VKARGKCLINAREVPIAEEFRDIRELIAETREVDSQFAQLAKHGEHALHADIIVGP